MEKLSVIIPVSDQPEDAREVLQSVDAAVDFLRRHPEGQGVGVEVVVVDDGSHPATRPVLEEHARGRPGYQLFLRGEPSNRACARNLGASLAAGDLFFFLDGDGLFLENHLLDCLKVFQDHPEVDFVKSPIVLSDPVHPDWVGGSPTAWS